MLMVSRKKYCIVTPEMEQLEISYLDGHRRMVPTSHVPLNWTGAELVPVETNEEVFERIWSIPVNGVNPGVVDAARTQLCDMVRRDAWWLTAGAHADSKGLNGTVGMKYGPKDAFYASPWHVEGRHLVVGNFSLFPFNDEQIEGARLFIEALAQHAPSEFLTRYERILFFEPESAAKGIRFQPALYGDKTSLVTSSYLLSVEQPNDVARKHYYRHVANTMIQQSEKGIVVDRTHSGLGEMQLERVAGMQRAIPLPVSIDVGPIPVE